MLSRALILATVTLLIGHLAAAPAHAQATNLEAGKSPSQIFAGTCTVCHKSPRGLLKTVAPGSLPSFLRQHYTTSPDMAGLLSSYLISNGATDTRYGSKDAKPEGKPEKPGAPVEQLDRQGRRLHTATPGPEPGKPEAKPESKPAAEPRQAAKPDADGINPQGEEHGGRNAKRLVRPTEEGAKPAEAAAPDAAERGPDGRKLTAKQRLSKRGKPMPEEPKDTSRPDTARDEPAAAGPAKEGKPATESAKEEASRPEGAKPSADLKSEPAKPEPSKPEPAKSDTASTEAPKETTRTEPGQTPTAPATAPATAPQPSSGASAPAGPPAAKSAAMETPAPTISVAPAPPAALAPSGPPEPPISK